MNLRDAAPAIERLRSSRQRAHAEALLCLRTLEASVKKALSNEPLRGLPNLMPDGAPFYAVRLHGRADAPLPRDESWVRVVLRNGVLANARWSRSRSAMWLAVTDEDFKIEDFAAFVNALSAALDANAERTEKTARNYEAVARLAARIREAVRF